MRPKLKNNNTDMKALTFESPPTCLILSGGGSKIVATIGALCQLHQQAPNVLSAFRRFVGTSAGAIICLLLCCGYSIIELQFLLDRLDMASFISIDIGFLFQSKVLGLDDGAKYMKWMANLMTAKQISPSITLQDLEQRTGKKLITITTDVNSKSIYCFTPDTEPSYPALYAVRASIGIPILFKPIVYGERCLVDGGLLCAFAFNLLVNLVDENETILGIVLEDPDMLGGNGTASTEQGKNTCGPKNMYEMFCICMSMMTTPSHFQHPSSPLFAAASRASVRAEGEKSANITKMGRHRILHIALSKFYNIVGASTADQDALFAEGWACAANALSSFGSAGSNASRPTCARQR